MLLGDVYHSKGETKTMTNMGCVLFTILLAALAVAEASKEVGIYELKRGNMSVKFTNYGARMVSLVLPDKNGKLGDIVLGYDTIHEYMNDSTSFGAIVGRVANRIGGAQFTLNGTRYKLVANDGNNTLHGGHIGFSNVIWTVESYKQKSHIAFSYHSYDGEQGFPGDLSVSVTFKLVGTNKLHVKMKAKALDKATPVNLALHTYWNLGGHNSGDILKEKIQIFSSEITPVDAELIPTGEVLNIEERAYDFLQPREIGSRFSELPNGYDINYVVNGDEDNQLRKVAIVQESVSGRKMELWSNQPGVQFYTGNYLINVKGKGGFVYEPQAGLCLETQGFPDSVNHPNFPSQIVNPGKSYEHVMVFRFTT